MKRTVLPVFAVWFLIAVIWSSYRLFFALPEWFDEFLFKPLIFFIPLGFYLSKTKQLNTDSVGLRFKPLGPILVWGVGFGLLLVLEHLLVWYLKGRQLIFVPLIGLPLLISISTAITEEILFRGFMLDRLISIWRKPFFANLVVSLLFALTHMSLGVFKLNYRGIDLFEYLFLMFVLGFAQGYIYKRTRSVVASGIAHALWNLSNVFIA